MFEGLFCSKKGSKYFVGYKNKKNYNVFCLALKNEWACKKC